MIGQLPPTWAALVVEWHTPATYILAFVFPVWQWASAFVRRNSVENFKQMILPDNWKCLSCYHSRVRRGEPVTCLKGQTPSKICGWEAINGRKTV